MIIGITGKNCAGKDTVADYLKAKGFEYLSLSDAIRQELEEKNISPTRENLIRAGTKIREEFGERELARRIAKKILPSKNYVVVSIRNPGEVLELEKLEGFTLVNVDASKQARFERMRSRGRAGDPQTLEDFMRAEAAEEKNANSAGQQMDEVCAMAGIIIKNDSTRRALEAQIDSLLTKLNWKKSVL